MGSGNCNKVFFYVRPRLKGAERKGPQLNKSIKEFNPDGINGKIKFHPSTIYRTYPSEISFALHLHEFHGAQRGKLGKQGGWGKYGASTRGQKSEVGDHFS